MEGCFPYIYRTSAHGHILKRQPDAFIIMCFPVIALVKVTYNKAFKSVVIQML